MTKLYAHEPRRQRHDKYHIRKIFGSAVRARRRGLGFSQEELAERADLHRTYITEVENGLRNISIDNISKLADALEVSVSELFAMADG